MSKQTQVLVNQLEARIEELSQALNQANHQLQQITTAHSRASLLYDISTAFNHNLNIDAVMTTTVNLKDHFRAAAAEIYLITDTGDTYFKSSVPRRNKLDDTEQQELVYHTLLQDLESHALKSAQVILVSDSKQDQRCLTAQRDKFRSLICAPLIVSRDRLRGALSFAHPAPHHFNQEDIALLEALSAQIVVALENAFRLTDIQTNLQETHLMLDISRRLAAASNLDEVYDALVHSVLATKAEHCTLYMCEELNHQNVPIYGQVVLIGDAATFKTEKPNQPRFSLNKYNFLSELIQTQETLVIENIQADERLSPKEREFFKGSGARSIVINPLVTRNIVTGLLSIEFRTEHTFTERDLALYRTLCNQTTIAIDNARQVQRTEEALAETQTLYRAGRVLAGAADLQEILQESLVEFVYSLGLDQGGVTLISADRQTGRLMAYLEAGQLKDIEKLQFPIQEEAIYQKILLSGRPFVSRDVPNDARLTDFRTFNQQDTIKSMLQAPMIIRGETIGWIGADAVREFRDFSQREVDLARAMADQIAITIQNRRLLEQTELRADRLKAVARVGEVVTGLTDLDEVLNLTVDLIRDRLGFYHVSIFLLDETEEWAVVRASTGEVGKIMVERPHRLGVGSNSIVGFVTAKAKPRIASDVGDDAVHFENPLLPDTRSEMALPLISRGRVIGALDVQSVESDAFNDEDIETLQIMADQLSNVIENARLIASAHESQTFMKAIIDQIPDPIFIKDRDHRLTVVNKAFAEGILGQPEENVLGFNDYDFFSKEEADSFWEYDRRMFDTGEPQEIEEINADTEGRLLRALYTRKIPLTLTPGEEKPEYLIGIINDITERKLREAERERLIEETRKTLDRTQTLYRISDALATAAAEQQATFETVLGEYLQLLGLKQGSIMLFDKATNCNKAEACFIERKAVKPELILSFEEDRVFQHLQQNPHPLIIEDVRADLLTKDYMATQAQSQVKAMLFIPLVVREQLIGSIALDVIDEEHVFSPSDIDIGEAIADQLTIWLENRRLLREAQYRSERLQTAARVSQAASSILDIDQLIDTSVNLIRDQFNFYYVGIFLVDEAREWAVLRAGTGEAGRIQLEQGHKLKIGGESMIGWSVANRQARIALDVGEEAVHFHNPYLPETHSEMALPLISRDQVLGAVTVQSVERAAFSDEDITLLQTMADHVANTIQNARLFENAATRLKETQALQEYSEDLSGTLQVTEITEVFFKACTDILGFDFGIFSLVDSNQERVKAIAGVGVTEEHISQANHPLDSKDIMADIIRTGKTEIISGWDDRFDKDIFEGEGHADWGLRIFTPITLRQKNIGLVEVGFNKNIGSNIQDTQIKLLRAFIDQTALALESAQRYEATQKAAYREQIIREITGKIRNSVTVDDILKTTVIELSKVVGASSGNITLNIEAANRESSGRSNGS
jgi:PAS domain S-box-containing protein